MVEYSSDPFENDPEIYKIADDLQNEDYPDYKEVFRLLQECVMLGHAKSMLMLSTWYRDGIDPTGYFQNVVEKNDSEFIRLLKLAAEQNLPDALHDLAVAIEKGHGIEQDDQLSFEYFVKAALYGSKEALRAIGRRLKHGIGISKYPSIAEMFFERYQEFLDLGEVDEDC